MGRRKETQRTSINPLWHRLRCGRTVRDNRNAAFRAPDWSSIDCNDLWRHRVLRRAQHDAHRHPKTQLAEVGASISLQARSQMSA